MVTPTLSKIRAISQAVTKTPTIKIERATLIPCYQAACVELGTMAIRTICAHTHIHTHTHTAWPQTRSVIISHWPPLFLFSFKQPTCSVVHIIHTGGVSQFAFTIVSFLWSFGEGDSRHFGPMCLLFLNWCRECFAACVLFHKHRFSFPISGHQPAVRDVVSCRRDRSHILWAYVWWRGRRSVRHGWVAGVQALATHMNGPQW